VSESLQSSGQLGIWAEEIRAIGGTNPLLNFEANSFGQLDFEKAHPGGLAQFVSGRSTTLSSLFREPLTFSKGLAAARRIAERGAKLQQNAGINTIFLAGGLVGLAHDGFDLSLPVVLWPVELHRRTEDFEVAIVGRPLVNPGLVTALEVGYGVNLDSEQIIAIVEDAQEFLPIALLEYLSAQVGAGARLETKRLLTVANFGIEPILLQGDLPRSDTKLLRELGGLDLAHAPAHELPAVRLVLDADSVQEKIIQRAVAGDSFSVETLPGCGYTQTVVNALANLAFANKRVLVVTPRRQTLNELADRLSSIGLAGLGIRSSAVWFDLVAAISRHEKASQVALDEAVAERERALSGVEEYFSVLSKVNPDLGVSIEQILNTLATLSLMPHAPTSSARISKSKLIQHKQPANALRLLEEAFDLGEFAYGPQDTPWFGARFADADEAQAVADLAKKLADSFGELRQSMALFTAELQLRPATTFEDWGVYLHLAAGIGLTLDRFVEDVFERDLAPLVLATGPRTARSELSGSDRRRLRKLAKEYLRPGMHVSDLHLALVEIQEQKTRWDSLVLSPSNPRVASGVGDLQVKLQGFAADLRQIQKHLDTDSEAIPLVRLPLQDLESGLKNMSSDLLPIKNFAERARVVGELRELGLGDVSRDFSRLHVKREHLAVEFDQVFWQSALEYSIAKDSRILTFTTEQIEVLESDFKAADKALVELGAASLAQVQAAAWHAALAQHPNEASALKALLRTREATIAQVAEVAPEVAKTLTSVVFASPYEVPAQLAAASFDVVIVLDAAGTNLAENLSALSRAEQIIAFGDDAIAAPIGFEIECNEVPLPVEPSDRSIFDVVRGTFGGQTLRRSWRPNGQSLGRLINREFYQNRISFEPTAAEYLGDTNFTLVTTKSLDAEVEKTVAFITEHARRTPELSLLVGTASNAFSDLLKKEIQKKTAEHPDLEEFFDSHGREKFEVATIAELSHRTADVVIFSLGLDTQPELLAQPLARKFIANLLVSARTRILVVTSLASIPAEWPMAKLLNDVLAHIAPDAISDSETEIDPMLTDLANRLRKLGVRVTLGYGEQLPLVISYGNKAAVIQADWVQLGQPIPERLRLHPALLDAMGWQLIRVHSFELFSDPQTLALRIAIAIGMPISKSQPALFDVRSNDDTDVGWGDSGSSNDRRLKEDKPPHWG
jgi:hypothetical protein